MGNANFTPDTLTVAEELHRAGFTIFVSAREKNLGRRLDWFQFRKDGRIGYYSGDRLAESHWSMPIKPSRENGSSMWVESAEDALSATEAATIITRDYNWNHLVGRQANYASSSATDNYAPAFD